MKGQGKHDSSDPAIERSRQNGGNKFVQSKVRMMSQQHTAQPQAGSAMDQSGPRGLATATEPLAGKAFVHKFCVIFSSNQTRIINKVDQASLGSMKNAQQKKFVGSHLYYFG